MSSVSPSKIKMETTSFNDLPQETALEILIRLPVKELIRSTSVNKQWYSLINNPSFISSQIHRCISHFNHNAVLIIPPFISHQNYCSLISTHTSSLIEKFDIPFVTKSCSLKLIAEIHGLLLLTDLSMYYTSRDLYLWNPYVKRHRVIVSTCFKELLDNRGKSYYVVGMGFNKESSDYRVVRIFYVKDDKGKQFGDVAPKVEIYSFRKDAWREINDVVVPRLVNEEGTYLNGSYYWVEMKQPGTREFYTFKSEELRVMSFDFDNEVFGEFKVPDGVPDLFERVAPSRLMQFEGSLALCVSDPKKCNKYAARYPYCIWLMRRDNGVISWTVRFRAVLKEYGPPLSITKTGTLILESYRSGPVDLSTIVSCNLNSMIYKYLGYGKHGGPEVVPSVLAPCTVDTSFPESLIMYEGGKLLLKYAK